MKDSYGPRTDFGRMVHAMKYRAPEEQFDDYCVRYARTTTDNDRDFYKLVRLLRDQVVLPAGRQQIAVGRPHQITAFNCFVGGKVPDDTRGIFDAVRDAAVTLRSGGGCGWDFSTLRPDGELVRGLGLGAKASGPVSFMRVWNAMCGTIMSAGERRGAMMGVLRCDHPDILKFVKAKMTPGALTNFNISVAATDAFMEAVDSDGLYKLQFMGVAYGDVRARDVWGPMMEGNWDNGEPGVLFIDRINATNPLKYCEDIYATNPCFAGETLVVTAGGAIPIKDLVGKDVLMHDGHAWREVSNFRVTGENQRMLKLTLQDGSEIRVTEAHSMILEDGTRKDAKAINVDDRLLLTDVEYDGPVAEAGAYLKGFLLGDGAAKVDRATLWLYEPKWGCKDRLVVSADEMIPGPIRTSGIAELGFHPVREGVLTMTGLAPRKDELFEWVLSCRDGLPDRAFRWTRSSKLEFLAGFLDADGSGSDGTNGFGYQCTSINKKMLSDIQILLKSVGVRSKLAIMHEARTRTFGDDEYECKPCWRLSMGQAASVKLAGMAKFSRLPSFADKELKYETKRRAGRVVKVEYDGIDETVYCCTVPGSHSVSLGIGVVTGQCAEQPLPPNGACLLGSVNLLKLLVPRRVGKLAEVGTQQYDIDYDLLRDAVDVMVRAFDNVIDRTVYPLAEQAEEAQAKRRMGVGVTAMANALETMGMPYGSTGYLVEQDRILCTVAFQAYRTSLELARQKGPFPLWDSDKYCEGPFFKTLPDDLQVLVRRHGLRNGLLTSIAPTGTISLAADNVSSGIEPVFLERYNRIIKTPEGDREFEITDAAFNQYGTKARQAQEISPREHVDVLCHAQRYVDSSISKTINITGQVGGEGPGTTYREFQDVYMDCYKGGAKGCATFNSNGKRAGILRPADTAEEIGAGAACVFDPATGTKECG